ncbi:hypothetical protein Y032_0039g34 [Ancylostoma ceylanicum]|nr:hypothetical protein Y032_0039g34 [Ancylostoma ceylanicum]
MLLENRDDISAVKLVQTDNPSDDGFVLAFVTNDGKKYLDKYRYRGIVFNDTFHVTRYAFRLATLLISDDTERLSVYYQSIVHVANMDTANNLIESIPSEVDPLKFESGSATYMTWLKSNEAFEMLSVRIA